MAPIHWRTPTLMVGSLVLAVLFAAGHHVFYDHLDGELAPTSFENYTIAGHHVSVQQANTAIGTAFAFLVRACLVFAVSAAYLQAVLWSVTGDEKPSITLENLDALKSALRNAISLGNLAVWWKRPLLFLIAIVAWLIPIASIVTPATLSVGVQFAPSEFIHVPSVAFNSLNLVADMERMSNLTDGVACTTEAGVEALDAHCYNVSAYIYNGPSHEVRRIVTATAAQGSMLSVQAPAANSSWSLRYSAPTLQCRAVNDELRLAIEKNIAEYTFASSNCSYGPGYIAWHPYRSNNATISNLLPFWKNDTIYRLNNAVYTGQPHDPASFFVAVNPNLMKSIVSEDTTSSTPVGCVQEGSARTYEERLSAIFNSSYSTILRCDIHNSTHDTNFDFVNGAQEVSVRVSNVSEEVVTAEWYVQSLSNASDLYAQDDRLASCNLLDTANAPRHDCAFDSSILSTLSYQALTHAFQEVLVGTIYWQQNPEHAKNIIHNSSVTSTTLTRSPELAFLEDIDLLNSKPWPSLQDIRPRWRESSYNGLTNTPAQHKSVRLQQALEDLYQNITISLMSSPSLQPNISSPFSPPPTEVTYTMRNNIYVYASHNLWLAYGLAVSATAVIVTFGIFAILLNNAAYSDDFSTILRLARGAQLSTPMHPADSDGKDPLPTYLKSARVSFTAKSGSEVELLKSSSNYSLISTLCWKKGKPGNAGDAGRSGPKASHQQDVRALALQTGFSEGAASGNDYENISLRSANDAVSPTSAMTRARRSSDSWT